MQELFLPRIAFQQEACTKFNTYDNTGIMLVFKKSKSWMTNVLSVNRTKSKPQLMKKAGFAFKLSHFGWLIRKFLVKKPHNIIHQIICLFATEVAIKTVQEIKLKPAWLHTVHLVDYIPPCLPKLNEEVWTEK